MSRIAVIGGGIGGLAAAIALFQRGFDVDVYEQSAELKEVGVGVQMGLNGTRVLHALGLRRSLANIEFVPARREIWLWNTGETSDWLTTANRDQAFQHQLADRDTVALAVAQHWQQERLREPMDWLYTYDATAVEV